MPVWKFLSELHLQAPLPGGVGPGLPQALFPPPGRRTPVVEADRLSQGGPGPAATARGIRIAAPAATGPTRTTGTTLSVSGWSSPHMPLVSDVSGALGL